MRPRLKATIALPPSDPHALVCLRCGSQAYEVSVSEGKPETFLRLMGLLHGGLSIEAIARAVELPLECVNGVLQELNSVGLLYDYADETTAPKVKKEDFLSSFAALASAFRFDMFRHPLFARLAKHETLFLAAAIEYGHIIRDASKHITIASKHASGHLAALLDAYLASEKDHYLALETSLGNALDMEFRFDEMEPLASTEALLLKTHDLAESHLLSYIACCATFEADRVPEPSDLPPWSTSTQAVYKVLREHAVEDCASFHSTLFEQAVAPLEALDAGEVVAICNALHTYKHYFDNLNYEILRVYSFENVALPRLRARILEFMVTL